MAGAYDTRVTFLGDASLGYANGQELPLIIDNNGDITLGSETFHYADYTTSNHNSGREPNVQFALADGRRLTIFVDGNTPTGVRMKPAANFNEMTAGVRPLSPELTALINDLIAKSPVTLTHISDPQCATFNLTIQGSSDNPIYFHSPAAYENFGDSYTRFVAGDGERSVKMYYSRLTLKDNGVVEWRPFNGNGNEYGDVWTTDADAIAAACP